jgi:hypothetical protein
MQIMLVKQKHKYYIILLLKSISTFWVLQCLGVLGTTAMVCHWQPLDFPLRETLNNPMAILKCNPSHILII